MNNSVPDEALDQIFRLARTHVAWLDKPVTDDTLRNLYELMKWGPTSANANPARFVFLRSPEAKARLRPVLSPGNVAKTMAAPVTVIVAYDLLFFRKLTTLSPRNPAMAAHFEKNSHLVEATAQRNSALQGAYMILAARAMGLDCGPMSGFDNAKLDEEFFGGEHRLFPDGQVKSNFLCNLGYGDVSKVYPRAPRLPFEEACSLL